MNAKQLWRWQGINGEGEPVEGALWAENRALLLLTLAQQSTTPLSVRRLSVKASQWRAEKSAEFIYQLATLLKSGLTLSEGLTLLAEQHPSGQWQALLQTLAHDLEQGVALSTALAQWPNVFPPLYQAMIRTGELTGKLDECCFELARQQKAQLQLAAKVKKALRYPIIILTMAMLVVLAMLHFVLPEFAAIYKTFNTPLPALTQGVMRLASVTATWGWLLMLLCIVLAMTNRLLRRRTSWQILRHHLLLRCPVMGHLARGQKLTQIFTVLALTQSAGIAFLQGLESVRETIVSPWWSQRLAKMEQEISAGNPVWLALKNADVFSPLCLQLVKTGETSGSLDTMLQNLARHHSENTQALADNLTALLEPALLVITGLIIGTLVVAMYLPVFHLGDAMSGVG
ncbi:type IV pilin biogenesis protein [Citrobacter amalonaticus]|uniref:Type IV pilin biogenesis protein n=1 Tax=Citrobacter amalonaticus TaxID=35703 RepID=A0A2S4RWY9_CITAM|nr:protein transport protein HofC [Citrobacter amalonaticus]POT55938.1 type IV pilin biogenesis protein [Citrobacter amalonaticus]POT74246.1 type IV pilin biogenesis protein [Citrobacter amalonaticus]POU65047.1 type IV pilin biogenesis protein [Citrobacter amalonaticus]POV03881.1 type IV pilin biogenesis protein [Citrobacter amalonaticus]